GILNEVTGSDCLDYLVVMSLIDYLVGNEDRHLNNFGIMSDRSIAPLFDFGLGLFEHDLVYEDLHFRDCIKKMNSKPFNRDNQKVIGFLQKEINIFDYLPDTLDLEGVVIPSVKATLYIKSCCSNLSIGLRG
ncbi:MAG: hypothetical protein IJ733_05745, partial [Lachnospiraceae bacterium]|nr:hypothetical protein [Lachnospiraceae bacterium]